MTEFDIEWVRDQFPGLTRTIADQPVVYFDGPAGSQVPEKVIDAISDYLRRSNANHGGLFLTSRESDAMLDGARVAGADLLNAPESSQIAFGANMTTLTFAVSRALAKTWKPGDEVIVTKTDHDANVTPWVLAARDAGVVVQHVDFDHETGVLDLADFDAKLSSKTKLVAIGAASNATGTIHPIKELTTRAHAVGACVFVDAVHYAPHGLIDVVDWDCDLLVCSAYKFFGPHVGVLYGKRRWLEELPAYKVRPASNAVPDRWMTGTQNHECIAGVLAAVEYLADVGRLQIGPGKTRRKELVAAFDAVVDYERTLTQRFLDGIKQLPDWSIVGVTSIEDLGRRVPTFSLSHRTRKPAEWAHELGIKGIFTWHGNFYALPLTETLGLEPDGLLRVGFLHYNTAEEVDRLLAAMKK